MPTADEPAPDELRFALAMNGGVSLAVWIGGVCDEVLQLCVAGRRMAGDGRLFVDTPDATWSVYEQLCWAARQQPRVDVLTGASAGGMNGVFLALALIYGKEDLHDLRELWIDAGGFGNLLRNPLDTQAPSLLRGDEYFLVKLQEAIRQIADGDPAPAHDVPIDLVLTATSMTGEVKRFSNDLGDDIVEREHRATLRFRHRTGERDREDPSIAPVDSSVRDTSDFVSDAAEGEDAWAGRERMVHRLARACRSTASFPGAFEPSRVLVADGDRVTRDQPLDCLLQRQASFSGTAYLIDGGTLVNLPVDEAIDAVFEQPAATAVRRVFAMVVPDPGLPGSTPQPGVSAPPLPRVVLSAVSTLPRNQTVGRFLEELDDHNNRVTKTRDSRVRVLRQNFADVEEVGRAMFAAYRNSRRGTSARVVRVHLEHALKRARIDLDGDCAREWFKMTDGLDPPWIPRSIDGRTTDELVRWGRTTVRRSAGRVLHLIERSDQVSGLRRNRWRATATNAVHAMQRVATPEGDTNLFRSATLLVEPSEVSAELQAVQQCWSDERANVETALRQLATIIVEMRGRGLDLPAVEQCPDDDGALTLLFSLETIENTFAGFGQSVEQRVERVRVDSLARSPIDTLGRATASGKVAGVQLGHFGAFLKASWRASDWMWGRLDGSYDLIDIVLKEARRCSLVGLAGAHGLDASDDVNVLRSDVSSRLKELRHADIVIEETPSVVGAIKTDDEEGGHADRGARALAAVWAQDDKAKTTPLERIDRARLLLQANRVGDETVAAQAGSDLLTRLSVTAFATGTTVVHRASPRVLSAPITGLRYVALVAWAMVRGGLGGPITRTLAGVAFGIGAAIVAIELTPGIALGSVAVIGLALFAAGAFVCFLRAPFVLIPLLVLVAGPLLLRQLPTEPWRWWPEDWPFPSTRPDPVGRGETVRDPWRFLPAAAIVLCAIVIGAARRPLWLQSINRDRRVVEERLRAVVGATAGWDGR